PLLLALLLLPALAQAQRAISFADYALPEDGAVAVSVAKGLPGQGSFEALDAKLDGALRRAAEAAGYSGDRSVVLNLFGVGPFEQVIVVGTGTDAASPRLLEDIG